MSKIDLVFTYPYPIETVWQAISEPAALAAWLMENDFKPEVGHAFQFRAKPMPGWNGIVDCVVTVVERPHRLAWTQSSGPIETVVTWTLEAVPEGTRVHLLHTGFEGEMGLTTMQMLKQGWERMAQGRFIEILAALQAGKDASTMGVPGCETHD
jgi:uncharacterized protein YndB with AHSA1/START domain